MCFWYQKVFLSSIKQNLKYVLILCIRVICRSTSIVGDIFVEFMKFSNMSIDFSFDNMIYWQIDGVSIGSCLDPVMATIFVGSYELNLLAHIENPQCCFLYVVDTFVYLIIRSDLCFFFFHGLLNKIHPVLWFTFKKENKAILPFLDALFFFFIP